MEAGASRADVLARSSPTLLSAVRVARRVVSRDSQAYVEQFRHSLWILLGKWGDRVQPRAPVLLGSRFIAVRPPRGSVPGVVRMHTTQELDNYHARFGHNKII